MHFNVYFDDETGQRLTAAAQKEGESRNALIRKAVGQWPPPKRADAPPGTSAQRPPCARTVRPSGRRWRNPNTQTG